MKYEICMKYVLNWVFKSPQIIVRIDVWKNLELLLIYFSKENYSRAEKR